jgi:hypothetical protein
MKPTVHPLGVLLFVFLLMTALADAQVKVNFELNTGPAATRSFKFKTLPSPSRDDAGTSAKLLLVDGEMDPNGADLSALTDGLLPGEEDEPASNFFFNAGTMGGRFRLDLGSVKEVAQVNTYSWHPNTRGPQVYKLYAGDGTDPRFDPAPRGEVNPANCGWRLVATVDTRPQQGEGGGQYAVSISDAGGSLGKYRYLLFVCIATEADDDWGNTFYSEVDVIDLKGEEPGAGSPNPEEDSRIGLAGKYPASQQVHLLFFRSAFSQF